MEIKNERRKRDAIKPTICLSLTLIAVILLGIFDIRKMGVEISEGTETTVFWLARVFSILLIPFIVYLLHNFIKQLFKSELIFRVSDEGIYAKITDKHIYHILYEDIVKISYKAYPEGPYIIFIFLKDPLKYLDAEQMERNEKARKSIPEAGDIHISSIITKEDRTVVMDLINFYIDKCKTK